MSEYQLAERIIAESEADTWDQAKLEWSLLKVYLKDEPDTCLCGHYPIKEICVLKNSRNGNQAVVGNCCVKKFIGLRSDKIFQALRRIHRNIEKALNAEAIKHAHQEGWISDWEYGFYFDTMRKRNMSEKQMKKRTAINSKILSRIKGQRRRE